MTVGHDNSTTATYPLLVYAVVRVDCRVEQTEAGTELIEREREPEKIAETTTVRSVHKHNERTDAGPGQMKEYWNGCRPGPQGFEEERKKGV
jgi:hypothetical protein